MGLFLTLCVLIGPDGKMFAQILHELHTTSSRFTASAESFAFYLSVLYVEIGYVRIRAYSLRSAFVTAAGTLGAFVVISEISLCDISYIIK